MDRRGSVLMGVLVIIGFSLLVGVPVLQAAQVEHKAAIADQMGAQAFYLAEAGIEHCRDKALATLMAKAASGWRPGQALATFGDGYFEVAERSDYGPGAYRARAYLVDEGDGSFSIRIESDGIVGGTTGIAKGTRITFPLITDGAGGGGGGTPGSGGSAPVIDSAVFVFDGLTMANSAKVTGDVKTNATANQSVVFSNSIRITGNLLVGQDGNPEKVINWSNAGRGAVSGTVGNLTENLRYLPIELPDNPDFVSQGGLNLWHEDRVLQADGRYGQVSIGSKSELAIVALPGETRVVRVSSLSLSNGGQLLIKGGGKVLLFVDGDISLSNNHTAVQTDGSSQLTVYQRGNGFDLSNGSVFQGTLVASKAMVQVSNGSEMSGNIYTGGSAVYVSNSGELAISLIYAPQATVQLSNEAHVQGAIVAKSCALSNSVQVSYDASVRNALGGGGSGSLKLDFGNSVWTPR